MRNSIKYLALAGAAAALVPASASAAEVIASLPDFDGPGNGSGFPIDLGTVGTFNFSIDPTAVITGAFFEGTFGTQAVSQSTAAFDATLDGSQFTVCPVGDPGCFVVGDPLRSFSIALDSSTYADLLDGTVDLGIIQTSNTFVRLGSPTLRIQFDPSGAVPEPSTWALLILGFGAIGAFMRRREKVTTRLSYS
ncbi:PEPxxWA-CTERM sorting domain-containing protein [Erythrobacter sp. W53]|uniref:PEPxxWA-CTERM sorting domain-containing protein n=1 Tax=Erythrobacter sp. W53 TaxID=3425947 RepID=UPI003D766D2B